MRLRPDLRDRAASSPAGEIAGTGRRDRGFTLIEAVIAIALMGTVAIASLSAVTTSIRASSVSRSAAEVETAIVNAADRVNRAKKSCDYTIYAQAAVQTEGWPASAAVVTQQYYQPSGSPSVAGQWLEGPLSAPACPGVQSDLLVQKVTIQITNPDGNVTRSIEVVKSDV
jgi:prepilin-type N-terminal cleavage/methylation domain-containing protein